MTNQIARCIDVACGKRSAALSGFKWLAPYRVDEADEVCLFGSIHGFFAVACGAIVSPAVRCIEPMALCVLIGALVSLLFVLYGLAETDWHMGAATGTRKVRSRPRDLVHGAMCHALMAAGAARELIP